VTNLNMIMPVL